MDQRLMAARHRSRRNLLTTGVAVLATAALPRFAAGHASVGLVAPPEATPAVQLTVADGKPSAFKDLLTARTTAVQLMFTTCSATCPIQGAIFAEAQARLVGLPATVGRDLQLLSISIDPLGDDPKALTAWLGRFGAKPQHWKAAVPRMQDLDRLLDFLRGRASGTDRHTAQAFLFDRQARLAYRTADMPAGGDLVRVMQELAAIR